MQEVRIFTEDGRRQWGEWLIALKSEPSKELPAGLLTDPALTFRLPRGGGVDSKPFASKIELAQGLAPIVASARAARLDATMWPGLWDWLAAFHFNSLCPANSNGSRKPGAMALYKMEDSWRRKYRHRIFGPVTLFERLGTSARLLIHGKPGSLTDWEEQAASRYPISSNRGVAEALTKLYWDANRNAPKRGAAPNEMRPGTLRRFSILILQLDRTYDLLSIDAEAILGLLPREFEGFRDA